MAERKYYLKNPKNKKAVGDYLKYLKSNVTDNPKTLTSHEINLTKILTLLDKDYNKITQKDLDNVFSKIEKSGTREIAKIKFKAFLKYKKLNKLSDHIKINSKYFKKTIKTDNDILSKEEIEKLRNSPNTIRDLAIIELLLTTGIRNGELVSLNLQNIEILKDEIKVKITKSKTRKRNISIIPYPNNPIAFYPNNFFSYLSNHPFKNQPHKPLFYSMSSNTRFENLVEQSLPPLLRKIGKIAGLNKNITPHILRHTSATHDGYHLTEAELELKYGWRSGSDMPKRYCHLNEETFNVKLKQKAGLTPQLIEEKSTCPYCNYKNNVNSKNCVQCKRLIDKKELAKRNLEYEEREQAINDQFNKYDKSINLLKRITKELSIQIKNYQDIIADVMLINMEHYKRDVEEGRVNFWSDKREKMVEIIDVLTRDELMQQRLRKERQEKIKKGTVKEFEEVKSQGNCKKCGQFKFDIITYGHNVGKCQECVNNEIILYSANQLKKK